MNNQQTRIVTIAGMMLLAALTRLMPHAPNFTAVLAVALFGGVKLKNNALAVILPLIAMLITDVTSASIHFGGTNITMGFHSLMPLVYGCIAITALIGIYISKRENPAYVIGGSLVASTLFFLVTNAGVWFHNPQFPQDANGLMACYTLGIPFYGNQVVGDLFFNGILFGAFSLAVKRISVLRAA